MATVSLNERRGRRATRKRLQPDRTGTGEKIEEGAARDLVADYVEDGLAHAILRRTDVASLGRLQHHAAKSSA